MFALRVFILSTIIAVLNADDATNKPEVEILTEKTDIEPDGYNFIYKTSDGVSRQEEGHLITVGDKQGIAVRGSYGYTAPDGQQYVVSYTADEKGYKPIIKGLAAPVQ